MSDPIETRSVTRAESGRQSVRRVILTITTVIVVIVLLRFIFLLLGANPENGFVNIINQISNPFVWPFATIFPDTNISGLMPGGVFEPDSLVAAVVWGIVGAIIARIVAPSRPEVVHHTETDIR